MVDQEVFGSQLKTDRFPFPSDGDVTLAVRNADYTLGPVMLHVGMKAGAAIPAHVHKGMAEALYVVEGDFCRSHRLHRLNQSGSSLAHGGQRSGYLHSLSDTLLALAHCGWSSELRRDQPRR